MTTCASCGKELPAGELDALASAVRREECVEPFDGQGDSTRARVCRVRLDEERGVRVDLAEHLVSSAFIWRSTEEPRVPVDAGVEIGRRDNRQRAE